MKRVLRLLLLLIVAVAILLVAARMAMNTPALESPVVSQSVAERVRLIYTVGQAQGNRAGVFSKVGDSITASPSFLGPVGEGHYQLGNYGYLQAAVDHFSSTNARAGNSFLNPSLAAGIGWAAWAALDPEFSDTTQCAPGEMPLRCEYRLTRPAFALIMFGTNDVGYRTPTEYERDLRRIIEVSESMGVVPILSTIPNRPEMPERVAQFNRIVHEVGAARAVPVWDYFRALEGLPNFGLARDNIHPSSPNEWYQGAADFRANNLIYGFVIRNLTALQMLDSVWRQVQ